MFRVFLKQYVVAVIVAITQREFHDAVLKDGALPLDILEEQNNRYIESKKAQTTGRT